MTTRFQWQAPAIPETEHPALECLVVTALGLADFLKNTTRDVVVRFIPIARLSDALVATIEEDRTGKLLGVLETDRGESVITLLAADPSFA